MFWRRIECLLALGCLVTNILMNWRGGEKEEREGGGRREVEKGRAGRMRRRIKKGGRKEREKELRKREGRLRELPKAAKIEGMPKVTSCQC